MRILRVEKVCPVCQGEFSVPPSLERTVCCSRTCSAEYRSLGKVRICPQCTTPFTRPPSRKQVYCSHKCGQASRRGKPHTNARKIEKVCPVCESAFTVPPSNDHVVCCSQECSRKRLKGQPRYFTPESHARLTGRPRTSQDITRACPTCKGEFTVRDTDPKIYCSRECYAVARRGERRPSSRIEKICPICDEKFMAYPSQSHVACCSKRCMGINAQINAVAKVRQMSDEEAAWFAGLFDGEGSVIITQRRRPGGGYVRITISNTCLPLLERAHELAGVGPIHAKPPPLMHHLDAWEWRLGGASALEILRQIRPWLISRAERADAVLAGELFPRQARWDRVYPAVTTPE